MVLEGFGWFRMVSGSSQMRMDGFRPVTAGSSYIPTDCGWFRVVEDGSGGLLMDSCG